MKTFLGDHRKPVGWISKKYQTLEPNLTIQHSVCSNNAEIWAISTFKRGFLNEIIAKIKVLRRRDKGSEYASLMTAHIGI